MELEDINFRLSCTTEEPTKPTKKNKEELKDFEGENIYEIETQAGKQDLTMSCLTRMVIL